MAIDDRVKSLETDVVGIKEELAGARVRLENGVKAFSQIDSRLAQVKARTEPKPPSIGKIVGLTLAIVLAGAGALWALANNLRDRPTTDQMEKVLKRQAETHEAAGHKDIRITIGEIQKEQGVQRQLIDQSLQQQNRDTRKLDALLRQFSTPPRPRRPRR